MLVAPSPGPIFVFYIGSLVSSACQPRNSICRIKMTTPTTLALPEWLSLQYSQLHNIVECVPSSMTKILPCLLARVGKVCSARYGGCCCVWTVCCPSSAKLSSNACKWALCPSRWSISPHRCKAALASIMATILKIFVTLDATVRHKGSLY